jgi:hypothetical protein
VKAISATFAFPHFDNVNYDVNLDVINTLSSIYFEQCVMVSNYVIAVYVSL